MLKYLLVSLMLKRFRFLRPQLHYQNHLRLYTSSSSNDHIYLENEIPTEIESNEYSSIDNSSNSVEKGHVYFVATPIGNVKDITLRALEILRNVDYVCAEDTRHTISLFRHISIPHKQMISHHEHNLDSSIPRIIALAQNGSSIAVVSDAGTPGISDPGTQLAHALAQAKVPIHPIPGASAVVTALSISGFPATPFTFVGFLPVKGSARKKVLDFIINTSHTIVFYESPHRIQKTFQDLLTHQVTTKKSMSLLSYRSDNTGARQQQQHSINKRNVVCCREITKLHEQITRGTVEEIAQYLGGNEVVVAEEGNTTSTANNENTYSSSSTSFTTTTTTNAIRIKGEFTVILGPSPVMNINIDKVATDYADRLSRSSSTDVGTNIEESSSLLVTKKVVDSSSSSSSSSNNRSTTIIEEQSIETADNYMSMEEVILKSLVKLKQDGLKRSEAVKLCAEMLQLSKSTIYAIALSISDW